MLPFEKITILNPDCEIEVLPFEKITILNPDCEIYDRMDTICGRDPYEGDPEFEGTIYGYDNSTAQSYAEKYGRKFVSLGAPPVTTTTTTNTTTTTAKATTTTTVTSNVHPDYHKLGDVNRDGSVNAVDVTITLTEYARLSTSQNPTFTAEQNKAADVNSNNNINAVDATIILSYYAYISADGTSSFDEFLHSLK